METLDNPPRIDLEPHNDPDTLNSSFIITAQSDILPEGKFGSSWLLVNEEKLWVVQPKIEVNHSFTSAETAEALSDPNLKIVLEYPLSSITKITVDTLVGASALTVTANGKPHEIIRYSSGKAAQFSHVQRQIKALIKKEDQPPPPEREIHCPKCGRPYPEDSQICSACAPRGAALRRIFGFVTPYKKYIALSGMFILFGTLVELAPPILTKIMIDDVLIKRKNIHLLLMLVLGLIVVKVIGVAMQMGRGLTNAWLGNRVAYDLRTKLFAHLQWLSLSYFDKRNSGAIMSRVTQDTGGVYDLLAESTPILIVNVAQLIGIACVLFYFNWKLAILVLAPAPFITALIHFTRKRLMGYWRSFWHRWARLSSSLAGTLSGMRVVKAFAQEDYEIVRFNRRVRELLSSGLQAERAWAALFPVIGFMVGSGQFLVWYFGGQSVLAGHMTLGEMFLFLAYLTMFYSPLQVLTRVIDWMTRSVTAAERIFEILDTQPEVKEAENAIPLPNLRGEVEFKNVSFGYQAGNDVLHDITFKAAAGEMIGLVGHSGAGKSTLINLLSRFYDPVSGEILIDGVPMTKVKMTDLRQHVGVVLQESFLFPGSIRDNISYAKHDASHEEILAAAKAANAHDFIMKFSDGYDTPVGERGQRLSGGERQRIAIARAILHDPKILILDEATASVDTETERQIQEALARLIENRTTFAIAHRLSTLRNADRLLVVDDGKIVEEGTHDELLNKEDGIYKKLVDMQTELNRIVAI